MLVIHLHLNNKFNNNITIMAIYLKKFENHTQYENYINGSGAILPNVSVCLDAPTTVHYNPWVDPYGGHEYVDLGLPSGTLWATMNVGANSVTDYGDYYMYGKGSAQYAETSGQSYYSGTENPLATSADTAAQVWGGQWYTPTSTQFNELTANTNYTWTAINGVLGRKYTSKTDATKYVFFPAGGMYIDGSINYVGENCGFLTSSPNTSNSSRALFFSWGQIYDYPRSGGGYNVRPVAN